MLIESGYKEITLLGQNVNSYNGGDGYGFAKLLTEINKIDNEYIIKALVTVTKVYNTILNITLLVITLKILLKSILEALVIFSRTLIMIALICSNSLVHIIEL